MFRLFYTVSMLLPTLSQCNYQTMVGACPEATSNLYAVSAYQEGCTTCFKFSRPITASKWSRVCVAESVGVWVCMKREHVRMYIKYN